MRCSYLNSLVIQWPRPLQTATSDKHTLLIDPNVEHSDFVYKTLSHRLTHPNLALIEDGRVAAWSWESTAQRVRGLHSRAQAGLDEVDDLGPVLSPLRTSVSLSATC